MPPFWERKALVCVGGKKEKGSGMVLVANPTTWPRLLTANAALSYPPSNVPRSLILPPFQRTARNSGKPLSGSFSPFSEIPAISPFPLIQLAALHWLPGSVPRLVSTPFCHWKALG